MGCSAQMHSRNKLGDMASATAGDERTDVVELLDPSGLTASIDDGYTPIGQQHDRRLGAQIARPRCWLIDHAAGLIDTDEHSYKC